MEDCVSGIGRRRGFKTGREQVKQPENANNTQTKAEQSPPGVSPGANAATQVFFGQINFTGIVGNLHVVLHAQYTKDKYERGENETHKKVVKFVKLIKIIKQLTT